MIVIRKKMIIIVSIFMIIVLSLVTALSISDSASGVPKPRYTVVVDAGHGGIDAGASGVKLQARESDINLELAKKLKKYLEQSAIGVVMTRDGKGGLYGSDGAGFKMRDMKKRKEIINASEADLVVSIHLNKYPTSSRRGAQVFFDAESEEGRVLADCIQKQFNTGINTRAFEPLKGEYYILKCSPLTSVIAECGFLSNPEEEALLVTDAYQDKVAYNLFAGIMAYLARGGM